MTRFLRLFSPAKRIEESHRIPPVGVAHHGVAGPINDLRRGGSTSPRRSLLQRAPKQSRVQGVPLLFEHLLIL